MKRLRRTAAWLTALTVSASCIAGTALAAELPFTDVKPEDWCYEYVKDAYENQLFAGTSETTFHPAGSMTRSMFVTVLYRQSSKLGKDMTAPAAAFTDISQSNPEFQAAIAWAAANHIVNGTTETTFSPNQPVNRQQMCAIIIRYLRDYLGHDLSGYAGSVSAFADSANIAAYAVEAVGTAQRLGIISGKVSNGQLVFDPEGGATRAAVAKVITTEAKVEASLSAGAVIEEPPVPEVPSGGTAAEGEAGASGGGGGGGAGGGGGGSSATHTAEEIALEKEVAASMGKIINNYEHYNIEDTEVKSCMDTLMSTMRSALDAHNNGAFIDRAYVEEHYRSTVEACKDQYSGFTEDQKSNMQLIAAGLGTTYEIEAAFKHFGMEMPTEILP